MALSTEATVVVMGGRSGRLCRKVAQIYPLLERLELCVPEDVENL